MSSAATLTATAMRLSEAAVRDGAAEQSSVKELITALSHADRDQVRLDLGGAGSVALPPLMVDMLAQVCEVLGRGDGIAVSEVARELTTGEAARVLGVSRPTLIGLLDSQAIASHKVGTHRRVALSDVLNYRLQLVRKQREAYEALMAEEDALGIYE